METPMGDGQDIQKSYSRPGDSVQGELLRASNLSRTHSVEPRFYLATLIHTLVRNPLTLVF